MLHIVRIILTLGTNIRHTFPPKSVVPNTLALRRVARGLKYGDWKFEKLHPI